MQPRHVEGVQQLGPIGRRRQFGDPHGRRDAVGEMGPEQPALEFAAVGREHRDAGDLRQDEASHQHQRGAADQRIGPGRAEFHAATSAENM